MQWHTRKLQQVEPKYQRTSIAVHTAPCDCINLLHCNNHQTFLILRQHHNGFRIQTPFPFAVRPEADT